MSWMSMMRNCFCWLPMLTNFFPRRGNHDQFDGRQFRLKFVNKLADNAVAIRETRYGHYFFLLENEGRKNLCTAAREFARIDRIDQNPETTPDLPVYLDRTTLSFFIKCNTIPISHLKTLRNQIVVSVEKNIFVQRYTFDLDIIESNLRSCSEVIREENINSQMDEHELESLIKSRCFEEHAVKNNRLTRLLETNRLNLCYAAKLCIEELIPESPSLLWRDNRVEAPQEFEIDGRRKDVAMECPTDPPVYVHLTDDRDCVQVFLVQNK